ncbi:MAG: glycoside hydrolase family 125 protein [Phycisphaerales bacterium]|nr:glycoside hydrolase family 125 protein [Phycisphaerales bacterium]
MKLHHHTHTTGNLWFALPRISAPPGGLERCAFLMMAHRGLVELVSGDEHPLLAADATIDGKPAFTAPTGRDLADWIPRFESASDGHRARLTWLAPHDERGWICRLELENRSDTPIETELCYTLRWGATFITTYESEPFHGCVRLDPDGWGGGIGLGWVTNRTEFALGIGCGDDRLMELNVHLPASNAGLWQQEPLCGRPRTFPAGAQIVLTCRKACTVAPRETAHLDLYVSVALDAKAACLDARYLREAGFDRVRAATSARLEQLNAAVPPALARDDTLGPLTRRNRLFAYFYALGRTLDTEEICPVTSRSSDYYVSAAYWDRDTLLWCFPTILSMDREMAAEVLRAAFGRQGRNIGTHSRFINGAMYEPGFELDELCAPILAVERYLRATNDWGLLEEIPFDACCRRIEQTLATRRHADVALYSTDYLPTDDLAQLPYCIYDNVLVWAMVRALAWIDDARGRHAAAGRWRILQAGVAEAIWTHGVVTVDRARVFAWSVDLDGRHRLYDEPPGSLALLAWYGFVRPDHPVFCDTCAWIYSPRNTHYFPEADEIGCAHEPHPWVLAIANSLLLTSRRSAALSLLRRAAMDSGLACEAIDENTGAAVSGLHFATCAGFLTNALVEAFDEDPSGDDTPAAGATMTAIISAAVLPAMESSVRRSSELAP